MATSDLHGYLPDIPPCDLLLIAGDITPVWNHNTVYQEQWLNTEFRTWLEEQPAERIVGIAGNHDFVFHSTHGTGRDVADGLPWTYLQDECKEVAGLRIYGSPYSNKFGSWAFMLPEQDLAEKWRLIPRDIDILMVHGPAQGVGDIVYGYSAVKRGMFEAERVGSSTLAHQLSFDAWDNLKLFVFGHIHEGYGQYHELDPVKCYNVSYMDDAYEPTNPPVVIDL